MRSLAISCLAYKDVYLRGNYDEYYPILKQFIMNRRSYYELSLLQRLIIYSSFSAPYA